MDLICPDGHIFFSALLCSDLLSLPLPPQGRGGSTGYDNAVALPAKADDEELQKENNKSAAALKGAAVFSVAKCVPAHLSPLKC